MSRERHWSSRLPIANSVGQVIEDRLVEKIHRAFVAMLASEIGGQGMLLTKHDGSKYHVRLDGEHSTCECKGYLRWSHCKHIESLLALEQAGKLPAAA